ncbi:hypothetical protein KY499_08050 [Arthrobacter sp. PAMC25284]|nr:hypothetical protein KY499_08050 [Arthrobacter sp. PAMC25284]
MGSGVDGNVAGGLTFGVVVGFAHGQDGEAQPDGDERGAEQERARAQPGGGGDVPRGEDGAGDAEVAGGFNSAPWPGRGGTVRRGPSSSSRWWTRSGPG